MQKITPTRPHKSLSAFSLHSTYSFKVFHKKYPKHVHKLNIDSSIGRNLEPWRTKKILNNLIKLIKKSCKFKAIQDISLYKFLDARTSQALYVIKKFHRIQSLGLFWGFLEKKVQYETRKWLKHINTLQTLSFRQTILIDGAQTLVQTGKLNVKLTKDIKRRRIKKIIHSLLPPKFNKRDHYILNMNNYPSTIQELSLDLSKCSLLTASRIPMSQLVSMHKFSLLARLELLFPLETEKTLMILRSIPNSHLLTSLGLYLKNNFPMDDEPDLITIFDFIADCPELEKLDLRMTDLTNKLENLSRLSCQSKLKILNLWVYVRIDKHLEDLESIISNAVNLESLDITVDFRSDSIYPKTFSEFYKGISQLIQLKKLSLDFTSGQMRIKPVYPELVCCFGNLSQLEELSLDVFDTNLHLEFPSVLEGLNKIAVHQLKKFSMNFLGNYFEEKDEFGLIEVLEKMKRLRELRIEGFSFKQSNESLLKFKAVLEGYEGLRKIIWKDFEIPKEGSEIFFEMMISILGKKGVEEVRFIHSQQSYLYEKRKEILFGEILERNPALRVVEINSQVVSNNWYNSPFEVYKYI